MIIEQSWLWYMQQQQALEAKRTGGRSNTDMFIRDGIPLPAAVEVGA